MKRLALVAAALGIASLAQVETAEAGHIRFSGGGRVHARVHGNVSVHYARPAYGGGYYRGGYRTWGVRGHIYVGGYGGYYRPYYGGYYPRTYYYPVPSYYYYNPQPYYPVAPAPVAPVATAAVVAPPPRPELPRFGVGLFAGGVSVEDQKDSSDVGVLGRFRLTPGLIIEGELGKTSYENDLRVDRRLGASLVYEIGAYNKLAPYVLAGLGVQQADVGGGDYTTTQNFAEIGVGLRYAFSPNIHVLFDVRAGSRQSMSDSGTPSTGLNGATARTIEPPPASSGEGEQFTRARLAAMFYF